MSEYEVIGIVSYGEKRTMYAMAAFIDEDDYFLLNSKVRHFKTHPCCQTRTNLRL